MGRKKQLKKAKKLFQQKLENMTPEEKEQLEPFQGISGQRYNPIKNLWRKIKNSIKTKT